MKRAKFSLDRLQSDAFTGYMDGMSTTVSSKRYIDATLDYTYDQLAQKFSDALDMVARLSPQNFHHVYEWGREWGDYSTVGNPAFRLWFLDSVGKGNNRTVGFNFLPSRRPSPVNPLLLEEGKTGRSVKEGVHVFVWKAPVMEYALPVTIAPQLAKSLAFVEGDEVVFSKGPIRAVPGRGGLAGSFSGFFLRWWGGGAAEREFDKTIRPKLENDLGKTPGLSQVLSKYRRPKQVNISLGPTAAFQAGRAMAQRELTKNRGRYLAEAQERRYELYGDD